MTLLEYYFESRLVYFGDDDGSSWLLQIDDIESTNPSGESINELLTNENFRAGILDKYFMFLSMEHILCCVAFVVHIGGMPITWPDPSYTSLIISASLDSAKTDTIR